MRSPRCPFSTGARSCITVWSADGDMLEDYGFENTKLNVGLTDLDFDPENADYNF